MTERSAEIMLIEEDPGRASLTRQALLQSGMNASCSIFSEPVEALAHLAWLDKRGARKPRLILIDSSDSRPSHGSVLQALKADAQLKHIPVLVLASSAQREDVLKAYDMWANCYIPKPECLEEFAAMLRTIESFWLSVARLPGEEVRF
ncbi:MAG TPA: response regulator [Verrucomicrobiae bacterium]|jgi:two-component system response regulator